MEHVRFRTNAKVNLFLRVRGRRPDGYHEVETILQVIRLSDEFEVSPTTTGRVEIEMTLGEGLVGILPSLEENLVMHAADRLLERGAHHDGIVVRVKKGVPIGAGLGGGSGNAAGFLSVMSGEWGMDLTREELLQIAGAIGSDVPYCIDGGTALATARGEKLTPLPAPELMWFVLGLTNEPLATGDVYAAWDDLGPGDEAGSAPMTLALGAGDVEQVGRLLHNDLERAAFLLRPELEKKKRVMLDEGVLGACMSGSGPTIYGMASDERRARAVASAVEDRFDRVVVVRSQPECIERL